MKLRIFSFWAAMLALLGLFLGSAALAVAPTFPSLTGRVVDQANILPLQTKNDLSKKLEMLERQTSRQLVVVTVSSLQGLDIADYGYQLGRTWGIGEKRSNTGVLLIVAPNERRVRIEVGYGLEPVLTDALSSVILEQSVLPKFRAGDPAGGVAAGTAALIEQLSLPVDQAKARVATAKSPPTSSAAPFPLALIGILVLWVVFGLIGTVGGRRGHRGDMWLLPFMLLVGGGGHGRRGAGLGGMGGGMGGGGFSGGGGSFGGGGASGRW